MPRTPRSELTGTIRGTRGSFAFLVPDEGGEDLFIAGQALAGAIHGDRVRVSLSARPGFDYRPEVQVEEIIERRPTGFTGNLERVARTWFVRPDSPLLPERMRVRLGPASGMAGAKILFRVENRPGPDSTPVAIFQEHLGDEEDARLDPVILATEFGLALRFSEEAASIAEGRAAVTGDPEDLGREDYRDRFILTIDPPDAKDFDDAVSLQPGEEGGWLLGVHIADVSFYVPEGSALDREAAARGTSVYFPGTVVPMLPEIISTFTASLTPNEDHRTLSIWIEFDRNGVRRRARVARGWIKSRARLHYAQAQEILEGRGEASEELCLTLRDMWGLAARLRAQRFAEGGFELDVPEPEMTLGPDGVPISIHRHVALDSHRLIEEFMIAANRAVGAWVLERATPFLFRVHQEPDAESLARFVESALTLIPGASQDALTSLPRLRRWLEALPDSPLGRIVQRSFLRSLHKAVYAPVDLGHFGLGIRGYCHFTSPIRRYPDLFDHRRVKNLLDRAPSAMSWDDAHHHALRSSRAEVNAQEAEREMQRLKSARYMARRLGEEFAGHITGLSPQGFFVELTALPVSGFVTSASLAPGLSYSREEACFVDRRGQPRFRPGDPVRVLISRVDLRLRRIDLALVAEAAGRAAPRTARMRHQKKRPAGSALGRAQGARRSASEPARAQSRRSGGGRRPAAGSPKPSRPPKRRPRTDQKRAGPRRKGGGPRAGGGRIRGGGRRGR